MNNKDLKNIFSVLLQNKIVDALLIPQKISKSTTQTLVKDHNQIKSFSLEPFMTINSAKIISSLTRINPKEKIGAVLRPCEIKAAIELHKLKMVNLEKIFVIGIECQGVYDDYEKFNGKIDENFLRTSCKVCESIIPENVGLVIQTIGIDLPKPLAEGLGLSKEIFLKTTPEIKEILKTCEIDEKKRDGFVRSLIEKKKIERKNLLNSFKERISTLDNFLDEFSSCIKCYNCRRACPICYCRECIFDTNIFEHSSSQYLRWVERKGGMMLPADRIIFHLTRLNHMASSCIGCGMCSFVCPMDLPVFELFYTIGKDVQKLLNYIPGRSIEDELPLSTFREDEFQEIGG